MTTHMNQRLTIMRNDCSSILRLKPVKQKRRSDHKHPYNTSVSSRTARLKRLLNMFQVEVLAVHNAQSV